MARAVCGVGEAVLGEGGEGGGRARCEFWYWGGGDEVQEREQEHVENLKLHL